MATVLLIGVSACGSSDGDDATGQSGDQTPSQFSSPTEPSVAPDARYGAVEDLRDAAILAGYPCPNWKLSNKVTLAAQSGNCGKDDVLSTFASDGDLQAQLDSYKGTDDMLADAGLPPDPHLVGPNWIITGPNAPSVQGSLGGTIVTPKAS